MSNYENLSSYSWPKTVPNQKVAVVQRLKVKSNFLQISNEVWQAAFRNMTPSTFGVYLQIIANADGFPFALGEHAAVDKLGISKKTYQRAIASLIEKGYLVHIKGNAYYAYEVPYGNTSPLEAEEETKPSVETKCLNQSSSDKMSQPVKTKSLNQLGQNVSTGADKNREDIDKKDKINKIDSILSVEGRIEEAKRKLLAEGITEEEYSIMYNSKPKSDWEKFPDCQLMFNPKFQNEKLAAVRAEDEIATKRAQEQLAAYQAEQEREKTVRTVVKGRR